MSLWSGSDQANAVKDAGELQELAQLKAQREIGEGFGTAKDQLTASTQEGLAILNQFSPLIEQGLSGLSLLTDRQAQTDFIQNDPITQNAISDAARQIRASAAATGSSLSGDELQALTQSSANIGQQALANQQGIFSGLLNTGLGLAGQQAGLQTGLGTNLANLSTTEAQLIADSLVSVGDIQGTSLIGQQNAKTQAQNNLLNTGLTLAGSFLGPAGLIKDKGRDNNGKIR